MKLRKLLKPIKFLLFFIMNETSRQRIIEHARDRFFAVGFSKVTMDELSQELGISKKTMYQHFPSKNDLLDEVVGWQVRDVGGNINTILESPDDVITKLYMMWTVVGRMACRVSKQMLDDVQRHRPDLWKRIEEMRKKNIQDSMSRMVDEGIRRGFVRSDVNKEVMILMYISSVQGVVNPDILTNNSFSTEEALKTILRVFLDGILTESARKQFHKKILQHQYTGQQ